jgi:nicotinamidase-related amidase
MAEPEHLDVQRTALIVYDACRRALTPADPVRRQGMRPVLDAWVRLIGAARGAELQIIWTCYGASSRYLPDFIRRAARDVLRSLERQRCATAKGAP